MTIPIRVNAPNPDIDGNPDVTALADGRAAIAYQSRNAEGEFDIVMRIREADGTFGPEYLPEGSWTGARGAHLTTLNDGTLILSWLGRTMDGEEQTDYVFAQRFAADGTDPSPVVRLAADVPRSHSIAANPDGGFVLYKGYPSRTTERFDSNNAFQPAETTDYRSFELTADRTVTLVQSYLSGEDAVLVEGVGGVTLPQIDGINNYDWWPSFDRLGHSYADTPFVQLEEDRFALLFNERYGFGDPQQYGVEPSESSQAIGYSPLHAYILTIGEPDTETDVTLSDVIFLPEDRTKPASRKPEDMIESSDLIALEEGGFAITWTQGADVYAQVVDASGAYIGDNFEVASGDALQRIDSLAQLDNGNLFFVWQEKRGNSVDVMSREVTLAEMAEGDYVVEERPYMRLSGSIEGDGEEGGFLRIDGEVDKNYPLASTDFQWFRSFTTDGRGRPTDWEAVPDATGLRYDLDAEDIGATFKFEATVRDVTGLQKSADLRWYDDSYDYRRVENVQVPAEGTILVEGNPVSGTLLTARPEITDMDGIPDNSFFYRWLRDGEEIDGAFRPTYRLTDDNIGARVEAEIRFIDGEGTQERVVSDGIFVRAAPTDGDDILIGGPRAETIAGLAGDDRIDGGLGSDTLRGDAGEDIFVFARDYGVDVIEDFTPGTDRVEFDFDGIGGVKALLRIVDFSQVVDDVRIDFGDDDVLILRDVDKGDLTAADALFV